MPSNDSLDILDDRGRGCGVRDDALAPRLRLIEAAISADSDLASQPVYVEFLLDALLRGDSASRAAFYTVALNPSTGWITGRRSEIGKTCRRSRRASLQR